MCPSWGSRAAVSCLFWLPRALGILCLGPHLCLPVSTSAFSLHFSECQACLSFLSEDSSHWIQVLKVLAAQSCLTLCDPMDCRPPGSSVHRILQARILEWVAIPSSRGSSQPRDRTHDFFIAGIFFTTEPQGSPNRKSLPVIKKGMEINIC